MPTRRFETVPATYELLRLARDQVMGAEDESPPSPHHRVLVDGIPGEGAIGAFGNWSERIDLRLEEPHPDLGRFFRTKYFAFSDEVPGLVQWGHEGGAFMVEVVLREEEDVMLTGHLPRVEPGQLSLFNRTAEEALGELGVAPEDLTELYKHGLLSFDPLQQPTLGPGEEAELGFLASMVRSGFGPEVIRRMVADLEAPYRYVVDAMVYDFARGRWLGRELPDPEQTGHNAIEQALEEGDLHAVASIGHAATEALYAAAVQSEDDEPWTEEHWEE